MTLSIDDIERLMRAMGTHRVTSVTFGDLKLERPLVLEQPKPQRPSNDDDDVTFYSADGS